MPLILIVEDEFLVRLVAAEALRDAGYRVIEADDADEAVSILDAGVPIELVFSDVRMPGSFDGLGLLGLIRTNFPRLPVVMCSGHLNAVRRSQAVPPLSFPNPIGSMIWSSRSPTRSPR